MSDITSPITPWFLNPEDIHVPAPSGGGAATDYTVALSGSSGTEGAPVTLTLVANGTTAAIVTPVMTGLAGAFSVGSIALNGTTPVALTFTSSAVGTGVLSSTNNGGLTDPASQDYTSNGGAGGLLSILNFGEYFLAYRGPTSFRVGANGPFLFFAWRADGANVPIPNISSCTFLAPDDTSASADTNNPSDPVNPALPIVGAGGAPTQILPIEVFYALDQEGDYTLDLSLAWGSLIVTTSVAVALTVFA